MPRRGDGGSTSSSRRSRIKSSSSSSSSTRSLSRTRTTRILASRTRPSRNGQQNYQPFIKHLRKNGVTTSTIQASKKALLDTETNWKSYRASVTNQQQPSQQRPPRATTSPTTSTTAAATTTTMSSTKNHFSEQQRLANKKHSELTDSERIFLLKREIDNLRGQVREKNGGSLVVGGASPASSSTASSASSGGRRLCRPGTVCRQLPLLSLFLVVGVVLLAHLRRRRVFEKVGELVHHTVGYNWSLTTTARSRGRSGGGRSRRSHANGAAACFAEQGTTEGFELPEHNSSFSSLEAELGIHDDPPSASASATSEALATPTPPAAYEAPEALDVTTTTTTTTQFV